MDLQTRPVPDQVTGYRVASLGLSRRNQGPFFSRTAHHQNTEQRVGDGSHAGQAALADSANYRHAAYQHADRPLNESRQAGPQSPSAV